MPAVQHGTGIIAEPLGWAELCLLTSESACPWEAGTCVGVGASSRVCARV
jgi:hypothetical protein